MTNPAETAGAVGALPPPTSVVRLPGPRDLLAYLPYQLGFRPHDSVVTVSLRSGGVIGLLARVDVADLAGPSGPVLARSLVRRLLADGAVQLAMVLYTGEDPRSSERGGARGPGHRDGAGVRAVRRVQRAWAPRRGAAAGWVVPARGALDLDCADAVCCPPGGRPLDELDTAPAARRLRDGGATVADRREDVGQIPRAGKGARRSASEARSRWADALVRVSAEVAAGHRAAAGTAHAGDGSGRPGDGCAARVGRTPGASGAAEADEQVTAVDSSSDPLLRWRRDSFALWSTAMAGVTAVRGAAARSAGPDGGAAGRTAGTALPPPVLGRIEAALADLVLRDAVLLAMVDPGSGLADRVLTAGGVGRLDDEAAGDVLGDARRPLSAVGTAVAGLLDPARARLPDRRTVEAARAVLEGVVAHGRHGRQAAARTLLALLAWWSGDGVLAAQHVAGALRDDPEHALARVVHRLVESGLAPAWVRHGG